MFGGQQNTPFGSPQGGGGFGATNTAPAFGSPAPAPFGAPNTGFGGGTAFGSPAPAPGGFGGGSGFGAAPSTGFGGSSGFGAPAPASSGFGATGGFGSSTSSPFGAPAPAPSGSLFGAPAPAPGGLFGGGAGTNTFGAPNTTPGFGGFGGTSGGFGSQGPTTTFGTPAQPPAGGGLFGAQAPAPAFGSTGGFGATSQTTAFGSPAPATGGSLFGSPPATGLFGAATPGSAGQQQQGTKAAPFQVTNRQDGTNTVQMQSITAMPNYENKCFEELRYEDYMQGNRGSASTTPTSGGFGGFGAPAPAPSGSLFGAPAPASSAFGAPAPAPFSFGAPAPAPFGAPAPAPAFGSPAPAPFGAPSSGGLFGAPTPAPSAFGAPAPAFGGFGAKPPGSGGLFGAAAPTGGLFGSSPTPAPAFGAPAPASGGLFGSAPNPAPGGGLFGAPAPAPAGGGLFGAPAPAQGFGAPAPSGGLFGSSPAPQGGLFGSPSPAPAFGAPASGGLFGAPAGGGLFGAKPPGTSLFGAPAPAPSGGLFGTQSQAPQNNMYGAAPAQPMAQQVVHPVGSIIPPVQNEVLAHQLTALENKRKELDKLDVWRGKSPESSSLIPLSQPDMDSPSRGLLPSQQSISPYRALTKSNAKIRPRGFAPKPSGSSTPLSTMGSGARPMMSPDSFVASSVKRLVIKPGALTPKPKMRLRLTNSPNADNSPDSLIYQRESSATSPVKDDGALSPKSPADRASETRNGSSPAKNGMSTASTAAKSPGQNGNSSQRQEQPLAGPPSLEPGLDYYNKIINSPDAATGGSVSPGVGVKSPTPLYIPKLTKPGYEVSPSIQEMSSFSEADLASVTGFTVRRPKVGMIEWEGSVDVRGADIDRIVDIAQRDISVYLIDEQENTKPAVGSKLNRPAVLTFYDVFPKEGPNADDQTKNAFTKKIEKTTKKIGAELISYNQNNGEWKIRVQHFSRYWLDVDSDEEEKPKKVTFQKDFSPAGSLMVGILKDEEMEEDIAVVSDVEAGDRNESDVQKDAEAAYEMMFGQLNEEKEPDPDPAIESDQEDAFFKEDDWQEEAPTVMRYVVKDEDYVRANSGFSICSQIASKVLTKSSTSSSTDLGMRMGRSFRVGWSPDGTFFRLRPTGTSASPSLVRCRPLFREGQCAKNDVRHLLTHKEHASRESSASSECPRFVLPQGFQKSGNLSAHGLLQKTIASYTATEGDSSLASEDDVGNRAFSLLSCLLANGKIENPDMSESAIYGGGITGDEERRREFVCRWLVESCEKDVDTEIRTAMQRNDAHSAVFAALSGGDFEKASTIALETGLVHLGVLLASGVEGQRDIMEQLRVWQEGGKSAGVSQELLRIYKLIGGNLSTEEKQYKEGESSLDWRRHLAMRFSFGSIEQDVAAIIKKYNSDVAAGVAPFPHPRHATVAESEKMVQCVLYRLLRLAEKPTEISLLEIVDPLGYAQFVHDYSFSFHIASVLTAMGICPPLSLYDEFRLSDSYEAQLVSQGCWEWAVYVSLCSSGNECSESTHRKILRAKGLVVQHFNLDDRHANRRRRFLEEIGVPSKWIEEALAFRYANGGDPFEFIQHTAKFSVSQASVVIDAIIVPNLLFRDGNDVERSLKLLEAFSSEISPLGRAMCNLFELYKDIRSLSRAEQHVIEDSLPALLNICDEIEMTLMKKRSANEIVQSSASFIPCFKTVPLSCMLAEAMHHVTFLKLQLKALSSGMPISDSFTGKFIPTDQLAFLTLGEYDERFSKGSRIVRGLR